MALKTPDPGLLEAAGRLRLPDPLGFGSFLSPVTARCRHRDGRWEEPEAVPYGPLSMEPTCKVLHYGQEVFEGMKAYRVGGEGPLLFRPGLNAGRFDHSAGRMAMPTLPEGLFLECVEAVAAWSAPLIPTRTGESLYIRPFLFTTEESLGITPPKEFLFMVVASPSGNYFTGGSVSLLVERDAARACPGGTGTAKTGGNYAAGLRATVEAARRGFDQVLWLDALTRERVEELSAMNVFFVVGGALVTPALTDTILDGVTRRSLLELARARGMEAREEDVGIGDLLSWIESGRCTEAFACGTAVIITPVSSITDRGRTYALPEAFGPVTRRLREELLAIQEGRADDPFGWVHRATAPG